MLKKIPVDQLRLGMFLARVEGRWLDHPFWRASFAIERVEVLAQLRECGVKECWIDVARGLDVAAPAAPAPAAPPASLHAPAPPARRTLDEELQAAAAVCRRGREAVVGLFTEARLGRALEVERCAPLVEQIAESVFRNPDALVSLARLKTRDDYTYLHSVAVCALMVSLGRQLGLDDEACRQAGLAGLVHDIGKAAMPLAVLNKPGKLSEQEFGIMRGHPQAGHDLLAGSPDATPAMLDVTLHHHERIDGAGYPHQLAGDAITHLVRMGAVCDVYDAITSDRPYKAGWDPAESIARMASWKGHFDEDILKAFVRGLGIYPTGSLVRLASGKLAVVVEQNPQLPVAPVVKVFFSTKSQMPIAPQRVDLARPQCSDRIVGRHERAKGEFPQIDELWAGAEAQRRHR
ncbi:MAG: HD-GYP domain-containing protein [Rubrivivax sp.]|nr:HD-GYP domain-containing protein [Rubrivivax sp.]